MKVEPSASSTEFTTGLLILLVAQTLSAYMGAYIEDTYTAYGASWTENLFYSHFLALPLFLPLWDTLSSQWTRTISSRLTRRPSTNWCRIGPQRRVIPIPQRMRTARVYLWRQPSLGQVFRSHRDDCAEHPQACKLYPQHDNFWA
jgi:hypothetical protein